jgi:phospholipase/carboxylesterase
MSAYLAVSDLSRRALEGRGIDVDYHESDAAHQIDPDHIPAAVDWLSTVITPATSRA